MDPADEDFFARLLATFSEEAADHLQTIITGTLQLEQDPSLSQHSVIEPVYRATHSLKGAARAVGLKDIETVCQHLESLFSLVRKGNLTLTSPEFDLIHEVITALESLLSGSQVKITPLIQKLKNATQPPEEVVSHVASSSSTLDEAIRTPKKAKANEEKSTDAGSPAYHTQEKNILGPKIRISEERLTTLYEAADDLLSYRMSAGSHLSELKNIAKAMQSWRWTLNRVEGDVAYLKRIYGASSDVLDRVLRFIENTRDMIGNCEIKLDATIKTMFQDHAEMDTAITQLIESIKEVVLVPFSTLIDTFPRMVRDIAHEEGKKVRFSMSGSEIEIDRRILEVIKDPLIHLIRNAVDHGIEPVDIRIREGKAPEGVISLEIAHTRANRINISISDDGRGIDPDLVAAHAVQNGIIREDELESLSPDEKIELIFQSGFTTAPQISRVSGRGLGLAIVLEKTSQVGGTVEVTSIPGKKTCFVLTVPVTLATFSGLMVHVENRPFFLPLRDIERVLIPALSHITTIEGRTMLYMENQAIPIASLASLLGISQGSQESKEARSIVIVNTPNRRFGLAVNQIAGVHEIVVRTMGPQLKDVRFVSGVAIMSNSLIVPVLHLEDIADEMQGISQISTIEGEISSSLIGRKKIMVVEDSITSRMLLKNILEGAGYDVETAVDGLDAFTRLKTSPVDLVVSDVDMPRMNGFVLTEKIRSEKGLMDLPIILVTSLDSREDREHGISVGANAYIVKSSFDQGNLLEVITGLIGAGK